VLAQIFTENTLAKKPMGAAVLDGRIKRLIEILDAVHCPSCSFVVALARSLPAANAG